jgi:hypothetical protein
MQPKKHPSAVFMNNTAKQLFGWAKQLRIFRVCRSPGGQQETAPDAFSARATFPDAARRSAFLASLGTLAADGGSIEIQGYRAQLHLARTDAWFNITSGRSVDDALTEKDFETAKFLDGLFQLIEASFVEPWNNEFCICPRYYPEVFSG